MTPLDSDTTRLDLVGLRLVVLLELLDEWIHDDDHREPYFDELQTKLVKAIDSDHLDLEPLELGILTGLILRRRHREWAQAIPHDPVLEELLTRLVKAGEVFYERESPGRDEK